MQKERATTHPIMKHQTQENNIMSSCTNTHCITYTLVNISHIALMRVCMYVCALYTYTLCTGRSDEREREREVEGGMSGL